MSVQAPRPTGTRQRSEQLLERAKQSVAGGDSSTMRVLPYQPALVIDRGEGCRIWDVDENEYIDLNMAFGPLLFGHRPPFLVKDVVRQLEEKGSQLGLPQELSFLVAEKVRQLFPNMERLRFANSGTESTENVPPGSWFGWPVPSLVGQTSWCSRGITMAGVMPFFTSTMLRWRRSATNLSVPRFPGPGGWTERLTIFSLWSGTTPLL
jgi:hypothetical protein